MSIVKEKPQLDFVLKAHSGAVGQEIKQKDRHNDVHNDVLKIYSCFKEFKAANFETLNTKMKFSFRSSNYFIPSDASTLSGMICTIEDLDPTPLQTAEKGSLNFNQLTESYSVITGRATGLCSCPEAPEKRN